MKKSSATVVLVLVILMVGFVLAPSYGGRANGSFVRSAGISVSSFAGPASHAFATTAPASPHPSTTFPRTVLIETFTGQWCPHCPKESQGLYNIEHTNSPNVLTISELHTCYSSSSCGDNYQPADGTTQTRGSYYGVNGFPTVFFDGNSPIFGDLGPAGTVPQLEAMYNTSLANQTAYAGNVSIAQTAALTSTSQVTVSADVSSGVTGTFHVITYLMEFIGKNDSTGHDILNVVRSTLMDRAVNLTAGETTLVTGMGTVGASWNVLNMSAVTFVQEYSTKVIENANMVPVDTMTTSVAVNPASVSSGGTSTVTVTVSNSTSGAVLPGATVTLSTTAGGTLSPMSGLTAGDGTFMSTFTAPNVTSTLEAGITAQVVKAGFLVAPTTAIVTVSPLIPPTQPTGLTVLPQDQQVLLNWSAPSSGGGGVTYHILRSTTQSGSYAEIGTSLTTSYTDTTIASGQSYWYTVTAQGTGGFSADATAISATSVVANPHGLPSSVGWWLSIDSAQVNASLGGPLSLYLPNGPYSYTYGSLSYDYLAVDSSGIQTISGSPVQFTVNFAPNYAILQGTVTPSDAQVVLNGTAVTVTDGSFTLHEVAGTYPLVVTAPGYTSNMSSLVLTPGNLTTTSVQLHVSPSTGGPAASNGGVDQQTIAIALIVGAIVAAIVVVAVFGMMKPSMRKRKSPPRSPPEETGEP